MASIQEHPSQISTWLDGGLQGSPAVETATQVVWFTFDAGSSDQGWEGLLATPSGPDRAVVRSVPYFLYDVALGDEVSTMASGEGALVATGILQRSGKVVFRVMKVDNDDWLELMRDLEPWSCWFDVRSPTLVALAAPPEHAQQVADYLAQRELAGELQYETGRTA